MIKGEQKAIFQRIYKRPRPVKIGKIVLRKSPGKGGG